MIITSSMRTLIAKMGVEYENSSTQVQVPEHIASSIISWGKKNIPDSDLHNDGENSKGRENDIHATLGYGNKGRRCSDENRQKSRLRTIAMLKATNKSFHPGYNKKACEFFDRLMVITETRIQHALNGGEFYIEKLGYWIDGYDHDNNIVYEFDERRHYDVYGNLSEKNKVKQKEITEFLKCRVFRVKWNEVESSLISIKSQLQLEKHGDETFRDQKFTVSSITFSTPENERIQIPIGG